MSDRETFWKRLDDVNAGMLGCDPDWRLVPMSHYADPDEDALWFITAEGTDLAEAVALAHAQQRVHRPAAHQAEIAGVPGHPDAAVKALHDPVESGGRGALGPALARAGADQAGELSVP